MLVADRSAAEKFAQARRSHANAGREATLAATAELARRVRLSDLETIGRARLGHIGSEFSVVDILGDGELQEGSNWEAAMTASHHALGSLTAFVDRNRLQQGARTEETIRLEPLADKWTSFGWEVRIIDGHDHGQILTAVEPPLTGQPVCVIASTIKGKGVSFMEDRVSGTTRCRPLSRSRQPARS